ncbi:MAG TPA: hypothetical protein DCF63_03590 [Planctomycetaceae bacterium]|nr:hypothetical protein [Planctomycetaceae bacterium]
MSEHKPEKKVTPPRAFGWMAEYSDENAMLDAARKVRDAGYTRTDVFAPFPVHGIDEALGIKPTILPWFTLVAGATGLTIAVTMQIWMNAVDYPYIISGKPYISLPAFVPVMFELTVLFSAFTTVFAMLGLNGLPRFSNPLFANPKFDRATDDRFFLWVDSRDKYFNSESVKSLLQATSPLSVEEVREDDSPAEIPRGLYGAIACLILLTIVPLALVWNIRADRSGSPRWHVFFDMDFQPFRKSQKETTHFADRRTDRRPVPGTVARGGLAENDPYYLGYTPDAATAQFGESDSGFSRLVNLQDESEKTEEPASSGVSAEPSTTPAETTETAPAPDSTEAQTPAETIEDTAEATPQPPAQEAPQDQAPQSAAAPTTASDGAVAADLNYAWLNTIPEALAEDKELFELGQRKFNQVCAVCHGHAGFGDGLVAKRAESLAATYWLQPTSVHDPRLQQQAIGRIYYTITNGKGKMGGYGSTLNVRERWAVAFYVKALQRSQNAQPTDTPAGNP